uniref:ATP synthase protein MI25 n=1 Tax=Acer yangbiense TaxID=1000413 RepID=A0A5C7GQY6_9ROSI
MSSQGGSFNRLLESRRLDRLPQLLGNDRSNNVVDQTIYNIIQSLTIKEKVSSDDMMGQSFASLVPTVAAAESAIGVRAFLAGRAHPIQKSFPKPLPVQLLKDRDILNEIDRKSLGNTFKATLDGRIQAIQEESQQFPNPNEVVPPESNEQQRLLRISLRICGTVVESLPMARCAPKCEKTVQALLCRNLNVKSATLPNATSSRRIRLQDDLVTRRADPIPRRLLSQEVQQVLVLEDFWDIMPHDLQGSFSLYCWGKGWGAPVLFQKKREPCALIIGRSRSYSLNDHVSHLRTVFKKESPLCKEREMLLWTDGDPIPRALDGHQSHRGVASTYQVAYESRKLNETERRGPREGDDSNRIVHRGGGSRFVVKTDNVATSDFLTQNKPTPKQRRWQARQTCQQSEEHEGSWLRSGFKSLLVRRMRHFMLKGKSKPLWKSHLPAGRLEIGLLSLSHRGTKGPECNRSNSTCRRWNNRRFRSSHLKIPTPQRGQYHLLRSDQLRLGEQE